MLPCCRAARISVSVSVSDKRRSSLFFHFAICILQFALCITLYCFSPCALATCDLPFRICRYALRYALCVFLCFSLCSLRFFFPLRPRDSVLPPRLYGVRLAVYIFILYISCAFFASSSRNFGWAISRIAFILCRIVLPARAAIPQSVTM